MPETSLQTRRAHKLAFDLRHAREEALALALTMFTPQKREFYRSLADSISKLEFDLSKQLQPLEPNNGDEAGKDDNTPQKA